MPPTENDDANDGEPEEQAENTDLRALNEALDGPKGDFVITVESYDRDLLRELWTLQGEGVVVTESMQKGGHGPGLAWIVLREIEPALKGTLSAVMVLALKTVFDFLRSINGGDKKRSKARIRSRKLHVETKSLLLAYEDSVEIEVERPEKDEEDTTED